MVASHAFVALPRPALQCSLSYSSGHNSLRIGARRVTASSFSGYGNRSLKVRAGPDAESSTTATAPKQPQSTTIGGRFHRGEIPPSSLHGVSVEDSKVSVEGVAKVDRSSQDARSLAWGRIAILSGGDIIALLVFAAIGRLSHGMSVFDWDALRTADPFIAGWLLGAYLMGGYGADGLGSKGFRSAIFVALKSWALGIPVGLAIRGLTMGHFPPQPFILISMTSTLVLVLGWRATVYVVLANIQSSTVLAGDRKGSIFELLQLLTSLVRRW